VPAQPVRHLVHADQQLRQQERRVAVREKGGRTEFFAFSVEGPSSRWRLAGGEQGLLANLFNDC
jgi:hypothetical protein